jgi:DNA repair photolyase
MPFRWSLNPYTGCAHRCTFCFVRAFEARADRPFDDRYGRSIRVKVNIAEVLQRELARRSWQREKVVVGTATDPYQPPRAAIGSRAPVWSASRVRGHPWP